MITTRLRSFFHNYFRLEQDYFTVGGWKKDLIYFMKQGNIYAHLIDRIKFRIYPKFLLLPGFPSHIDIETASACQMRCPMCYTTYMSDDLKGVMKWDLFTKIIDEAAQRNVYSVKLSWRGEPLLNKKICEMVQYAKDKGIKEVAFLTNAELLTKSIAEKLVDAGLDWLSISADGVGKVYNEIRSPAIFEETVERVRYMRNYRDKKGLTKPLLRVQSILSAVEKDPETFYKSWDEVVDRINIIADHIRDFKHRDDQEYDQYYICPKPWTRINVAYDGRVHQCGADYSALSFVGDCNTQSLYEIWHGEGNTKVRDAFRRHTYLKDLPACKDCSYGLMQEKQTVNIPGQGEMVVQRYKSVPKVVGEEGVRLHTPIDKLTPRQINRLEKK